MGITAYIALVTAILVVSASADEDGLLRVPIKRMKSALQVMGSLEKSVLTPMLQDLDRMFQSKKKPNASVPLFKFLDTEFYGEVLVGHPGQKMRVIFDTAWANSWIISSLCPLTNLACAYHNRYDSSRSSTYVANGKKFNVNLGKHNLTGRLSTDLIHVGQANITNQTFAEIIDLPWTYIFSRADGVLGLAFDKFSIDNITPLFYNMIKQGVVDKQIFSFYMNRDPSSSRGGTLLFGGVEKRHYSGNFTFAPISKINYWQFHMEGVFVKGSSDSFCKGGCDAIADTSTNVIEGPEQEIILLNQMIGARPFYFGRYLVDCGKMGHLPTITFSISGRSFVLKARDYIQQVSWGGFMLCLSSFAVTELPSSYGEIWTLGGAFLSRFYVQFDLGNQRIGFADVLL